MILRNLRFQSTPPARGATRQRAFLLLHTKISIHAPREGGDRWLMDSRARVSRFQSTPPARGATFGLYRWDEKSTISIHAPREGGDSDSISMQRSTALFQSTPPARGATPSAARTSGRPCAFQSTPPARGATEADSHKRRKGDISIHAPREGGDCPQRHQVSHHHDFNPRPPRGGRP